ncbi:histidine phosphatase family protein [Amylibacter sp.]|nr:histidine phosphatase family protein [Amylibacter sp.]MDC1292239.1 histidine phosphatase family protein [Amylibacter sp.]MDC1532452.1 histidine phosphatase family protein [Amylibacter sp.]
MDINSKIKIIYKYLAIILMLGLSNFLTKANAENYSVEEIINDIDANVIFMRHALAPGIGDPNNFKIGDCSTQRNLNETGIAQAVLIGKQLKKNSIQFNKIYSSQWCRCYQTATLLDLGKVHEFAGLNSIFQNFVSRRKTLQKLEQKLSEISLNKLVIFVTHQVNIQAITKKNVASGEMVAFNTSTKKSHKINLSVQ